MATNGYSSPASCAHNLADSSGGLQAMAVKELARLLNTLLEAEGAGAKVLASDQPRRGGREPNA